MTIYVDIVSRKIISSPRLKRDVSRIEVKRGDIIPFSIVFVRDGQSTSLPTDSILTFCAKLKNDNEGAAMVLQDDFTLTSVNESYSYDGIINFSGENLSDYLTNEVETSDDFPYVDLQLEINWLTPEDENYTTNTVILRVYNDVFKGDESLPVITNPVPFVFPYGIKTDTIAPATTGGSVLVSSTLEANHIHGNIAGTLYTHVRTGEAVTKGDPVYVSGFHNGTSQPIVSKADASNPAKMPAIGVMDDAYAQNVSGANCVIAGTITSVDTDDFSINSPVYVGDGGGFSETIGTIPQQVGIVERSNQNHGAFVVTNNKVISSADISNFASAVEAIAPNAVTSATTSDGTAELSFSTVTTEILTVTEGMTITTGDFNFGTGSAQALKDALEIASADITDATNDGDANKEKILKTNDEGSLVVTSLTTKGAILCNSYVSIYKDEYDSASISASNITATRVYESPDASGTLALTASTTGVPDKLTDGTIAGTLTINSTSYTYGAGAAAAHRTALGLDTLFNGKANLTGGNTFTGAQSINGTVTTSDKVSIDSTSEVTNPKLLITASTASGTGDNAPLVIKGSGVNRLASINLRTTGGGGELYDGWVTGTVGGGIQVNNRFTVSNGGGGPVTGTTMFSVTTTSVGVGIGNPNAAAILDVTSTTKGFLPPRMTTTQRNAITSVPAGLVIYNTTTNNLNSYSGSAWVELVDSADLGTNVATFLETPTSANLAAAVTGETGSGALVFGTSPSITTPTIRGAGASTGTMASMIDGSGNVRMTIYDNGFTGFGGLPTTGQRVTIYQGDSNGSQLQIANTRSGGHSWIFGAGDTGSTPSVVPAGGFFFYDINGTGGAATRLVIDGSGNVGIGTTAPNAKAILDVTSTTKGFLPPRMTTTQRNAITSVPAGLMVYNTTTNKLNFYNGSAWEAVTSL